MTFREFQEYYYWSASAAKEKDEGVLIDDYPQDSDRARATKVDSNGEYVGSDYNNLYPDGGNASRTEVLRIRAFRKDLIPVTDY